MKQSTFIFTVISILGFNIHAAVVTAEFAGPFNGFSTFTENSYGAETFNSLLSGKLSSFAFPVADFGSTQSVTFSLWDTVSGAPNSVLAEITLPGSAIPDAVSGFFSIDMSSYNILMSCSTRYAVSLHPIGFDQFGHTIRWQFGTNDPYPSGDSYTNGPSWVAGAGTNYDDYGFRVSIVPEPQTFTLLITASICLSVATRRRTNPKKNNL